MNIFVSEVRQCGLDALNWSNHVFSPLGNKTLQLLSAVTTRLGYSKIRFPLGSGQMANYAAVGALAFIVTSAVARYLFQESGAIFDEARSDFFEGRPLRASFKLSFAALALAGAIGYIYFTIHGLVTPGYRLPSFVYASS